MVTVLETSITCTCISFVDRQHTHTCTCAIRMSQTVYVHVHVRMLCEAAMVYVAISHHDLDADTAADKCLNVASFKDALIKHVRIDLAISRRCWLLGWLAD